MMLAGSSRLRMAGRATLVAALTAWSVLGLAASQAHATPVTWHLNNVQFAQGLTLTGSFVENGGTVSSYDITFEGSPYTTANSFINCDGNTGATDMVCFGLETGTAPDGTPWNQVQILANGAMDTSTSGSFSVVNASSMAMSAGDVINNIPPTMYAVVSGSVTATAPGAVPEPGSAALAAVGVLGIGLIRGRGRARRRGVA